MGSATNNKYMVAMVAIVAVTGIFLMLGGGQVPLPAANFNLEDISGDVIKTPFVTDVRQLGCTSGVLGAPLPTVCTGEVQRLDSIGKPVVDAAGQPVRGYPIEKGLVEGNSFKTVYEYEWPKGPDRDIYRWASMSPAMKAYINSNINAQRRFFAVGIPSGSNPWSNAEMGVVPSRDRKEGEWISSIKSPTQPSGAPHRIDNAPLEEMVLCCEVPVQAAFAE